MLPRAAGTSGDFDRLFQVHPPNTFLIKVAHWFDS